MRKCCRSAARDEEGRPAARLDKLVGQARTHLKDGEEVLSAIQGSYETKIAGQDSVRKGAFIATDRRLVFYAKKLTGYELEVFPHEHISSIEMSKGVMGHHISFFASGNKVRMKWIDKGQDVPGFISAVKDRMKGGTPGDTVIAPAQPDVAEQLRAFAALRDQGILSEEEFQTKKAHLLGL